MSATPLPPDDGAKEQADQGWDTYKERVLRNEGRLGGLEVLVRETRESDKKLIEQRSDSLAKELERAEDALAALTREARAADQLEYRAAINASTKACGDRADADSQHGEHLLGLLREVYDTAIRMNAAQSHDEIEGLEQRSRAQFDSLTQQVISWRASDKEARLLQAGEYARRLDVLNHAHQTHLEFQANSVTRELWAATEAAWNTREHATHEKLAALEKVLMTMTPIISSDKAHEALAHRIEEVTLRLSNTSEARVSVLNDKYTDLKEQLADVRAQQMSFTDSSKARGTAYSQLYGWIAAGVGLIVSLIVIANVLTGRAG